MQNNFESTIWKMLIKTSAIINTYVVVFFYSLFRSFLVFMHRHRTYIRTNVYNYIEMVICCFFFHSKNLLWNQVHLHLLKQFNWIAYGFCWYFIAYDGNIVDDQLYAPQIEYENVPFKWVNVKIALIPLKSTHRQSLIRNQSFQACFSSEHVASIFLLWQIGNRLNVWSLAQSCPCA